MRSAVLPKMVGAVLGSVTNNLSKKHNQEEELLKIAKTFERRLCEFVRNNMHISTDT